MNQHGSVVKQTPSPIIAADNTTGEPLSHRMAGTNYGHGKPTSLVHLPQVGFHVGLGLAIGPERIAERCLFSDHGILGWLLVGGSRRDENVLRALAAEDLDVTLDRLKFVSQELADDIETSLSQSCVGSASLKSPVTRCTRSGNGSSE